MKIIEVKDQIEGGKVAFDILKETLKEGAQTLGLATGSSPLEFYKQIRESDLDLSNLISVNLDEYVGLTGDDPQSYRYFMEKNLFDAKPFKESYLPSGVEESADQEVIRYNKILEDISMGIANILAAKSIVLFAYGESKAQAIKGTVEGERTEKVPASALQGHPNVTIIADKEALSLLSR